jgi:hypothetical protein
MEKKSNNKEPSHLLILIFFLKSKFPSLFSIFLYIYIYLYIYIFAIKVIVSNHYEYTAELLRGHRGELRSFILLVY